MSGRRLLRLLGGAYILALAASHLVRLTQHQAPHGGDLRLILTRQVPFAQGSPPVTIVFLDLNPSGASPPVLVLHGSPGDHGQVGPLAVALANVHRVLSPALPGFGGATAKIPDYSIAAHAEYLVQLLDSLKIPAVHLVGYSMGGGVAIELADRAPSRVASLTLVSSIGVQEYELLGDHWLNHSVHGLQLAGL
ncbi:MAG: alpha/beta fold hydrolase, partial [Gemmatimonadota bacterium]